MLCFLVNLVSGLKEYIGANPSLNCQSATMVVQSKRSDVSTSSCEFEDELHDEFYDAIAGDSSSSEEEESEEDADNKVILFLFASLKNTSASPSSKKKS